MDTNEQMRVSAIDGNELLARLNDIGGIRDRHHGLFDANTQDAMNDAITVLRKAGYWPRRIEMVERDCYTVLFDPDHEVYPNLDHWPYWIKVRYIADGFTSIPLALAYHDGTSLIRYAIADEYVHWTGSDDARRMVAQFKREHADIAPVWVPLFAEVPALF